MPSTSKIEPPSCPNCGGEVHLNSVSCPHCGERPERWSTGGALVNSGVDLGLPEDEFDYEEFVEREFDDDGNLRTEQDSRGGGVRTLWIVTAFILVVVITILIILNRW